ncbi:MAG TPA: penicillin-binding protein 1C [Steroidobacteraceae bacterium]|nr:penicillin-binding protein 1C [Steroidobacteraceae bacterium]
MSRRVRILLALFALLAAAAIVIAWPAQAPDFAEVRAGFTPSDAFMLDRDGAVLDTTRIDFDVRRFDWQPLESISPALGAAVVRGEDARFWEHSGIDWRSVIGSARDRFLRGRHRGASTITMQVASLLQSQPHSREGLRAWWHKRNQARLALAIESRWTKEQILEAYLNLVSFRGELQGIGATAHLLAGKVPSGLSLPESLVIAALLPEPNASPDRIAARACSRALAAKMVAGCDELTATATLLLTHGVDSPPRPKMAPQLANALLRTAGERVQTTLDASIQRLARDTLTRQLSSLAASNVRDGAVLVADNATGDVLAYVGSAGPSSRSREVDGVRALRQAGSTLKPFLYELAMERGYLTAASLLKDSPVHLDTATGAYIPQDYDKDFKGLVSVRTALGSSLNIPAVRVLVLVGVEPFRDRLHELGYEEIKEDGDFYGYSLALGSAEVTLWQQAQAYRALAAGGRWSPLRVRADAPAKPETSLLPADATFIVSDILSDPAARALTFGIDNHLNTPFWSAAKTGTSKDMRDNWCIGFTSRYTVAVWVGNFEGDAMHDVSGVTGAAPVWREIMSALHQNLASVAPQPPAGIVAAATKFEPAVEPHRREWFLAERQQQDGVTITRAAQIARIVTPANGMVIASDPDIPPSHQKVLITAEGATAQMQLTLNGEKLASAGKSVLWTPQPGAHRLELQDANGRLVDRILFTVR